MSNSISRLLLVEDDEDDYILARDYIEQLSTLEFEIDWVTNQHDALAKMAENQHDICLLDYQLGAENGLTVLKLAIEAGFTSPIIMLTGQADEEVDMAALDAGAVDYIIKSELSSSRFARAIRYALARREIEKERVDRLKAEAENRSKDRFLAHLSHELRTPLTSILGYTELLMDSKIGQSAQSELSIVLNNSKHLLSLLNNMLDLSKIAADKLELNLSEVNLDALIADVYALMNIPATDKGLTLSVISDTPLPLKITTDATRFRQVLINLISNAIKFTEQGSVTLRLWCEDKPGCEFLHFSVTDTGIGIPANQLNSVFKPFEQVADVVSRRQGGSGLGLAICNELVAKMGGEVSLHSTFGEGSCFTAFIQTGDTKRSPHELLSFDAKPSTMKEVKTLNYEGRVLVVDDVNDIRMLVGHMVQNSGLKVEYGRNGLEALDKVTDAINDGDPYDLVLIDIHMPVMNGSEAIKQIRSSGIHFPVVAMTAATMKGVRDQLISQGFTNVLEKPINHDALLKVLDAHLTAVSEPIQVETTDAHDNDASQQDESSERQHFLLVEDDVDAADITALLLESLGIDVHVAHSGQECMDVFNQRNDWSKVLMDLNLPDASGLNLAKEIHKTSPQLELVLLSGEEPDAQSMADADITKFILKPINKKVLSDLVED
ncbi:histidine kinase [Paraglaciecola sp. T6c]|uniref:response regulator n=1 Tax=Pseudoalteromonas atlantica (strain T6c / ATCC BAA-1087) TaxID=3042615 RepID=UPI00005C5AF4|nr:response regulator [Paraglaciecola sp. T6c]ABG42651.1 histidine kinase [Paraglaciecola sp. T6c]